MNIHKRTVAIVIFARFPVLGERAGDRPLGAVPCADEIPAGAGERKNGTCRPVHWTGPLWTVHTYKGALPSWIVRRTWAILVQTRTSMLGSSGVSMEVAGCGD